MNKDPQNDRPKSIFGSLELELLAELRVIHGITENPAGCPPIFDSDSVTVLNVKNMAYVINRMATPTPAPPVDNAHVAPGATPFTQAEIDANKPCSCPYADAITVAGGWRCKANIATGAGDPQDCLWPLCGCDPQADRVIEVLNESNFYVVPGTATPEMEEAGRAVARTNDPSTFADIFEAMVKRSQEPSGLVPCDCPKGGKYSDGTVCNKCGGTEWIERSQKP